MWMHGFLWEREKIEFMRELSTAEYGNKRDQMDGGNIWKDNWKWRTFAGEHDGKA